MTDLPEQLPDARAVLAAAYQRVRESDAAHARYIEFNGYDDAIESGMVEMYQTEQAQALAAIGAGLATVEAYELAEDVQYAAVGNDTAGGETVGLMAAGRVVEAWAGLNYSARGAVQRYAPTLGNALNDAADLLGMTDADRCRVEQSPSDDPTGGPTGAVEVQPLPPVDDQDRCQSVQLGRRCVRLTHGEEEGHLYPPLVPAGPDRFA